MEKLVIDHVARIGGSTVYAPFLRAYADLIDAGLGRPYTAHADGNPAVYATNNGVVVGGIVYAVNKDTSTAWIVLSFVVPEWRRQNVSTLLHLALEARARAAGIENISSHVHVDNTPRLAACAKHGLKPQFIRMNKKL